MRKVSFKASSALLVQIHPGMDIDAIESDGKIYVAAFSFPSVGQAAPVPTETAAVTEKEQIAAAPEAQATPAPAAPSAEKKEAPSITPAKIYTEDELKDMPTNELLEMMEGLGLKDTIESVPGRNTNKKLRDIYLDHYADAAPAPEAESQEKEATAEQEGEISADDFYPEIVKALSKVDTGEIETVEGFIKCFPQVEFSSDEVEQLKAAFNSFLVDAETPLEEHAESFLAIFMGEDPAESPNEDALKEVAINDLKEGDEVSVYWDVEDGPGYYDGVVKTVQKGRAGRVIVTVVYSDGEAEVIDPAFHTKILRK